MFWNKNQQQNQGQFGNNQLPPQQYQQPVQPQPLQYPQQQPMAQPIQQTEQHPIEKKETENKPKKELVAISQFKREGNYLYFVSTDKQGFLGIFRCLKKGHRSGSERNRDKINHQSK